MEVLRRITGIIDAINERIGQGVAWLTLVIVFVGAYNAIFRFLARWIKVDLSSNGLIELQWYLFSVIFLLGASYTLQHNGHVRVDVLYDRLTPRQRCWINVIGNTIFLVPFCIFMLWACWPMVMHSWKGLEMSPDPGGLPRYIIKSVLPIAFVLLMLQGICQILKGIDELITGNIHEVEPDEEVAV